MVESDDAVSASSGDPVASRLGRGFPRDRDEDECDYLKNTLIANYELTRLKSKELIYSIFNYSYFVNDSPSELLRKNVSLKLMSNDRLQFIKLGNYLSNLHNQLSGSIFQRLKDLDQKASHLMTLIQKKYHLE